jgi:hypothetical protein
MQDKGGFGANIPCEYACRGGDISPIDKKFSFDATYLAQFSFDSYFS